MAADSLRARRLQDRFSATLADAADERRRLLEELLGGFGAESEIRPPFSCDYGYQIRIGARVFANFGLVALDVAFDPFFVVSGTPEVSQPTKNTVTAAIDRY